MHPTLYSSSTKNLQKPLQRKLTKAFLFSVSTPSLERRVSRLSQSITRRTKLTTLIAKKKDKEKINLFLSTCRDFSSFSHSFCHFVVTQRRNLKKLECKMVRAFERDRSIHKSKSSHFKKMFEIPARQVANVIVESVNGGESFNSNKLEDNVHTKIAGDQAVENDERVVVVVSGGDGGKSRTDSPQRKQHSDMEQMKERFAKLLLGEDMSGGGKGVSSALALSNAITNLAASVFGEHGKLEPMSPERKARWKKEIDWLLSVTDHIVEFVPSQQQSKDGTNMEIMVTMQRKDLRMDIPALRKLDTMLIECLDNFGQQNEFTYISKDADESEKKTAPRKDDKWWLPTPKVPENGLSDVTRKWLQFQKESVNQVLKAAMAINAQVLLEMEIPDNYIESLPKNGKTSLGDSIYKSIQAEYFDAEQFLLTMDLSTEHKVLDLKNKIEASMVIWKRKMHHKDGKPSWGVISLEKRELEERAETILLVLKQRFPGIPQSDLDISKIQFNRDIGQAILESYSRVIETLAFTVMSRIEDVLYADSLTQSPSETESNKISAMDFLTLGEPDTPSSMTLSDFMGWQLDQEENEIKKSNSKGNLEKLNEDYNHKMGKIPNIVTAKKGSYLEKVENLSSLRSPTARH